MKKAKAPSETIVVIINLGTPKTTSLSDVRKYLREFLMDPYVINKPYWFRWLLVNGIIVNFRSFQTRKSYATIWQKDDPLGSPLAIYTKKLASALAQKSKKKVFWAMRYGEPSIKKVIEKVFNITKENEKKYKVVFLPLYPHWAMSTTLTVEEEINKHWASLKKTTNSTSEKVITPAFYNDKDYIQTLADTIKPFLKKKWQKIIFSYHGIPESHLKACDPTKSHCLQKENCCSLHHQTTAHQYCYRHQVIQTAILTAKALKIKEEDYLITFQSRLGREPWLTPFTDKTLEKLPQEGVKNILMVCPSFVSDNLETLFENGIENQELFIEAGGKSFTLIPCLNLNKNWVNFLSQKTKPERKSS